MNLEEISKFVDLVQNPDKYAAAIAEFEQRQASWKALVETQTSIENADRFVADKRFEAEQYLAKAEQVLADAKTNAQKQKENWEEQNNIVARLKQEALKDSSEAAIASKSAQQLEKQLKEQTAQLEKDQAACAQRILDLNAKEADLNSRLEKLKALAS